jgi:NAD(P)-dependent dehydrogenase (short-subunit alcohol dehydrogenase family)
VNLLAPGPIAGARMDRAIGKRARATGRSESAVRESYVQASSLHRMVTYDDVVRSVMFLCSSAAANITGQTLEISAGTMAERF